MRRVLVLAAVITLATAGCGAAPTRPSLTVFAAASLRVAFTEIGQRFEADNAGHGVDVQFSFAGSAELATQLTQGARADVFASANTAQLDKVADAGLLAGPAVPFAANTLVIVTAPGNPQHVASFADLARVRVVICQQPVPCGAATHRVEDAAHVQLHPVSEEPDVTDVLGKVTTGQADAGVVYVTDARHAGDKVTTVAFPEAAGAVNTYPIAVLKDASEFAQRFVDLVTGPVGQDILHRDGFARPQ